MWYGWFSARHQRWIGSTRFPVGSHRRLVKRYLRPVHAVSCSMLMVGCKETVRARAVLLTHHQRINHFQSSCVTTVQESRGRRLQTTRETPESAQNPGINETELSSPFNRKPHVTDQDFIEHNILSLIIFNYLTENAACFADRQKIYADRYRRLRTTALVQSTNDTPIALTQRQVCGLNFPYKSFTCHGVGTEFPTLSDLAVTVILPLFQYIRTSLLFQR